MSARWAWPIPLLLLTSVSAQAGDPVEDKDLAKALFARQHADVASLSAQRRDSARVTFAQRLNEFLQGRGTNFFLWSAAARLRDAELALANSDTDRAACLESYWLFFWLAEQIDREREEYGRIPTKDYVQTRFHRRGAETTLRPIWDRPSLRTRVCLPNAGSPFLQGFEPPDNDPVQSQAIARGKWEAAHADTATLARQRLADMQLVVGSREKEFLAGRGTLAFIIQVAALLRDAGLAGSTTQVERLAQLEVFWIIGEENEAVIRERCDQRRLPAYDLDESLEPRLGAEARLVSTWPRDGQAETVIPPVPVEYPWSLVDSFHGPRRELVWSEKWTASLVKNGLKNLARNLFDAVHSDAVFRARERRRANASVCAARLEEFDAGRGTVDFLFDAAERLRDAELALATTKTERVAAVERYWRTLQHVEVVNRERYEANRIPLCDFRESQGRRADAGIELLRAQAGP